MDASLPNGGPVVRLRLLGVFAQFVGSEEPGTLGATVEILKGDVVPYRLELVNGRHYSDAAWLEPIERAVSDGACIQTVGSVVLDEEPWRVDLLTIDLPVPLDGDAVRIKSMATPASFAIFDVFADVAAAHGCPFHSAGGGVPLGQIGAIIRLGDRVQFAKAVDQLEASILSTPDLDEARGQALTFLAVVAAAMLEMGGSRGLLREQLDAARELERATCGQGILDATMQRVQHIAEPMYRSGSAGEQLVDHALALVDRNFAQPLSDASVAKQLGLSTSHFRYLFRSATGQPFHKYVLAVRLEKAKHFLMDSNLPVGAVARRVGFSSLPHFSRAFANRFNVSPTQIRRGAP